MAFLDPSCEGEIQMTALRWVESFFEICPEDILPVVPRLLSRVLPAMASDAEHLRQAAHRVNTSLMEYIASLSEDGQAAPAGSGGVAARGSVPQADVRGPASPDGQRQAEAPRQSMMDLDYARGRQRTDAAVPQRARGHAGRRPELAHHAATARRRERCVALPLSPRPPLTSQVLAINDETFPALLKTLSDPAEAVVTRDLQLLSQISRNSEDDYFTSFMVNLLQLFCTDRRLLETRGNLIIRQLCVSLSAERIYRTLADCLEKDEDVEFASIMVQNLNNNLITAPELADLRKRLKNLDTRV